MPCAKKIHIKFGTVATFATLDQKHVQTIRTKSGAAVKVVMKIRTGAMSRKDMQW